MKITEDSYAVGRGHGYGITQRKEGYTDGYVATPQGFVAIYAEGDETRDGFTRLTIIRNGRAYSRSFHGKRYSRRGIVTKALQFAEEIATNHPANTEKP